MPASTQLSVTFQSREGARPGVIEVKNAVIAGWTGRDVRAMEKHIRELEEIGVPRPAALPRFRGKSRSGAELNGWTRCDPNP